MHGSVHGSSVHANRKSVVPPDAFENACCSFLEDRWTDGWMDGSIRLIPFETKSNETKPNVMALGPIEKKKPESIAPLLLLKYIEHRVTLHIHWWTLRSRDGEPPPSNPSVPSAGTGRKTDAKIKTKGNQSTTTTTTTATATQEHAHPRSRAMSVLRDPRSAVGENSSDPIADRIESNRIESNTTRGTANQTEAKQANPADYHLSILFAAPSTDCEEATNHPTPREACANGRIVKLIK